MSPGRGRSLESLGQQRGQSSTDLCIPDPKPVTVRVIEVRVRSYASIPTKSLGRAQGVVTRIYGLAGVTVWWPSSDRRSSGEMRISPAFDVSVSLLPQAMPEYVTASEDMMGMTPRGEIAANRLAYVFSDRVDWFSRFFNADPGLVLGHAVAHAIGHFLAAVSLTFGERTDETEMGFEGLPRSLARGVLVYPGTGDSDTTNSGRVRALAILIGPVIPNHPRAGRRRAQRRGDTSPAPRCGHC
jgi:hypothetical protein